MNNLRLKIIFILILQVISINLFAEENNWPTYKSIYNEQGTFDGFKTYGSNKKFIGKKVYDVLFDFDEYKNHRSISKKLCKELCVSDNDTIVLLKITGGHRVGACDCYIKIGQDLKYISLSYDYRNPRNDMYIIKKLSELNQYSEDMTEMILLNVLFSWNVDDIECLIESSSSPSDYLCAASRIIVRGGRIIDGITFVFDEGSFWKLNSCYGNKIPDKYLIDLRYDSKDSTIQKYMNSALFRSRYWTN